MPLKIIYTPPPDKSITIRCIILASLTGKRIKIKNPLICDDTIHALKALKKLGCHIEIKKNSVIIKGQGLYGYKKNRIINVGESALIIKTYTSYSFESKLKLHS